MLVNHFFWVKNEDGVHPQTSTWWAYVLCKKIKSSHIHELEASENPIQKTNLKMDPWKKEIIFGKQTFSGSMFLVGGFSPTHLKKYARQFGSFPQESGWKFQKKCLKPPPRKINLYLGRWKPWGRLRESPPPLGILLSKENSSKPLVFGCVPAVPFPAVSADPKRLGVTNFSVISSTVEVPGGDLSCSSFRW